MIKLLLWDTTARTTVSFCEVSIAGDKAGKLQKSKDPDAARAYFHQQTAHLWAGGLTLGTGAASFAAGAVGTGAAAGSAAAVTATVLAGAAVFLLVGAFVAIGVAVYYGIQGEKLKDGPVDFWLDRCWWGKHQRLKQLKPYGSLDEELQSYFELFHTPQFAADWNDTLRSWDLDNLDIAIYLPGYQPGKSAFYFKDQINLPSPAQLTDRPLPPPEPVNREAQVYRIKLPTLKVKDGSVVSMTFRYLPNEKEWPNQVVEIAKTFKDD